MNNNNLYHCTYLLEGIKNINFLFTILINNKYHLEQFLNHDNKMNLNFY